MHAVFDSIRRRMRRRRPRPTILMYHRIALPGADPWGLSVGPEHFVEQLDVIARSRRPLSMSAFVDRLERRTLPDDAVAVTFDDGYADNLHAAKPRLEAADVPATVFVTTGAIGQRTEYWWDELARGILLRAEALDCEVVVAGEPHRLLFAADERAARGSEWRAWDEPRTPREATYLALWRALHRLPAVERAAGLQQLRSALRIAPPDPADLPMTEAELRELAAGRLFEIGGHTVTHPVLPTLDPAERRREILESRAACERVLERSIAGFAYPHGAHDADSRSAVRECGFTWACSTESRPVAAAGDDRYALPRIAALDWNGDAFERALQHAAA